MDTKYLSSVVIIVVAIAKLFGVEIGSEGLTNWVTALITVVSGVVIAVKSVREGKLNFFGMAKK